MNKLSKISIFLVAAFVIAGMNSTSIQMSVAQLEQIPTDNQTSQNQPKPPVPGAPQADNDNQNTKIKEALANIFELYQALADKGDVSLLLKLNNIERILLEMMK